MHHHLGDKGHVMTKDTSGTQPAKFTVQYTDIIVRQLTTELR